MMSFRYKILAINASLFLFFVCLFLYGTTQYIKGSYNNQLVNIKSGIVGQNTKLLETFIQSQNALLKEKSDFILEEVKYLSLVFQSTCVYGYPTLEYIGESLQCINDADKHNIKNITFVDLSKKIQVSLKKDGSTSILRYLSKESPLWLSESALKYKVIEDKITKKFFILKPINNFSNILLKFELDLEVFFKSLSPDELKYPKYKFLLLDSEGNFIASNLKENFKTLMNKELPERHSHETLQDLVLNEKIGSFTVKSDNVKYNVIYQQNETMKWKIILFTPESYLHSSYVSTRDLLLDSDNLLVEKIVFSSLTLFIVFLLLIYITVMKTFRPINDLIKQANYLKEKDFSNVGNIVYHKGDEIEVLSRAYSEAGRTIKLLVEGLEDEVKLRTEQYEVAAKEALDATNKKSTLLSNVSHEIRTPLNAIIGYLNMLKVEKCGIHCNHELEGISAASNTILDIVNDLLDFERLDSVNYKLHPKNVPINKIIRDIEKTFHPLAKQKGLRLNIVKDEVVGTDELFVDELRFQQALSNIITNAIKFTDIGEVEVVISINILNGQRMVIFAVRDTGRGIKKEDLETIFNSFEQANQEDKQFGFGLGLAITKAIINLMGGGLAVESKIEQGSIFKIGLPISMLTRNVLLSSDSDESTENEIIGTQSFDGIKALVVDDVEFNREILQHHLKLIGIESVTAIDGIDALNKLENEGVDVILTDVSMPNMDGVELANRSKHIAPTLPIIAVTARATVQEEEKMSHYFDNYITKPVREIDLVTALSLTLHK